jgi:hypothetical protein
VCAKDSIAAGQGTPRRNGVVYCAHPRPISPKEVDGSKKDFSLAGRGITPRGTPAIRGPTKNTWSNKKRRPRGVARATIQLVVIEVTRISEHRLPERGFEV